MYFVEKHVRINIRFQNYQRVNDTLKQYVSRDIDEKIFAQIKIFSMATKSEKYYCDIIFYFYIKHKVAKEDTNESANKRRR